MSKIISIFIKKIVLYFEIPTALANIWACDRWGFHSTAPHSHLLFLVTFFSILRGVFKSTNASPLRLRENRAITEIWFLKDSSSLTRLLFMLLNQHHRHHHHVGYPVISPPVSFATNLPRDHLATKQSLLATNNLITVNHMPNRLIRCLCYVERRVVITYQATSYNSLVLSQERLEHCVVHFNNA